MGKEDVLAGLLMEMRRGTIDVYKRQAVGCKSGDRGRKHTGSLHFPGMERKYPALDRMEGAGGDRRLYIPGIQCLRRTG